MFYKHTLFIFKWFWFKYTPKFKNTLQIQLDQGLNPWPPDHGQYTLYPWGSHLNHWAIQDFVVQNNYEWPVQCKIQILWFCFTGTEIYWWVYCILYILETMRLQLQFAGFTLSVTLSLSKWLNCHSTGSTWEGIEPQTPGPHPKAINQRQLPLSKGFGQCKHSRYRQTQVMCCA